MVFYPENEDEYNCSFCGKPKEDVGKLIAGLNQTYICDECICVCANIIHPDVLPHDEEMKLRMFNDQVAKAYKDYLMIIRLVTGKKTWNDDDFDEDDNDGVL